MTDEEFRRAIRKSAERYYELKIQAFCDFIPMRTARMESPIERRLLAELAFIDAPLYFDGAYQTTPGIMQDPLPPLRDHGHLVELTKDRDSDSCLIYHQTEVCGYRVDFLLVLVLPEGRRVVGVVVECDGHDFHERTKEQAKRDRGMDRALTAAGFRVLRFTGSEIYRDAVRCAKEVEDALSLEESRTRPE